MQALYGASAEYALHSLLIISAQGEPVSVRDLARFQELPEPYLAKLFTRLEKGDVVHAAEGVRGGFVLARPPDQITVKQVLDAVEPDRILFECAEIRRHCALYGDQPPAWSVAGMCRIHLFMKQSEDALRMFLDAKTLADIGQEFAQKAPDQFIHDTESWFVERRSKRKPGRTRRDPA